MNFRLDRQTEIGPWQQGAIFLLACALIVSRRPDAIFHAQFWNEDGHVFFADAYNFGWWSALFHTYEGYYHAFPRLGAALALLVPLALAPLLLNVIAILAQAIPVNLLLSFRSSAWGGLRTRVLLVGAYLALPNCFEIDATITNSQWVLALIAFLLLAALRPRNSAERILEVCAVLLCGLTGPFCIFLVPIALFMAWRNGECRRWTNAGLLCATCLVQVWSLLSGGLAGRPHVALGASPAMLARVLAGQLYLGSLFGSNPLGALPGTGPLIILSCIAVGGTLFIAICFVRLPTVMRLFFIFSGMILGAALIAPTPGPLVGTSYWWVALTHGAGARYWFFPDLAVAWSILLCTEVRFETLRTVAIVLACLLCLGAVFRWEHPAFHDAHWAEYARSFEAAPVGTAVTIPESTPGWNLVLVRHGSAGDGSK